MEPSDQRMATEPIHDPGSAPLWFGILAPPLAFLVNLEVDYLMVPHVCAEGSIWMLHGTTLSMLALAIAGGVVALVALRRIGKRADDEPRERSRGRFMAQCGAGMSILFALIILAQLIAQFIIDPCMR